MSKTARAIWTELLPTTPVFSTEDVARVTGSQRSNTSRDLSRMASEGMITRVRRGLWAVQGHPDFSPLAVVPHLFDGERTGYVSILSALSLHGLIEQIPRRVHIVSEKQRPKLETPVGTFEFHRISGTLFSGFKPYGSLGLFDIASPEKAMFDTLYVSARKGKRYSHLPEVSLGSEFSKSAMDGWIAKVSDPRLRSAVSSRWEELERHTAE
ncbi:MAG: type IV toxin-antitoxin system AbiEi family antitoxin domain-containing protein [Gemmatimonadetes bacterium]|nr:type IV toxin-antitoxin system AbiEi family antitoxin domain-containing protein [Gemmatimonadota bacterium]